MPMPRRPMTAALTALLGLALAGLAPMSQALEQPPRWIKADDLRVRNGPGLDQPVRGLLQRGAQVTLKSPTPFDGFCLIEGDGLYGYVACQYLSADPVPRPRAGQGGVPADQRWVTGTAVILRAAPSREAPLLSRLAVNRTVRLIKADAGAGYCEVQPQDRAGKADGPSGFTACTYLGLEPLPAAEAAGYDPDPIRAFWRAPGWWKLEAHAQELAKALPESAKAGPWPRDEALERMKAHLALGLKGSPPPPLPDWAALKALAAAHDPALLSPARRNEARSGQDKALWEREYRASSAAHRVAYALGLGGPLHDTISAEGGGERVLRLMRALELPTAAPSRFKSEAEIGPPGENAETLAGRFGGIYRTVVTPRKPQRRGDEPDAAAGLYDMLSRTDSLTRPVQFVRLHRDGMLTAEPNTAAYTEVLWRDVDEPQCTNWTPGFSFGDVDGPIWRYGQDAGMGLTPPPRRAGPPRLFGYNALQAPPRAKAERHEQVIKLDREATGFVRVVQMSFDIDGDGRPDLVVLEGVGRGPGHLDMMSTTDDPWWRLQLANIGGAWKVLGHDRFGYGCGC